MIKLPLPNVQIEELDKLQKAFDEAPDSPDVVPAGTYKCYVLDSKLTKSKNGTLGWALSLRIIDGEFKNRVFFYTLWITPSSMPVHKRLLKALGVKSHIREINALVSTVINLAFEAKVTVRTDDQGRQHNEIRDLMPRGVHTPEAGAFPPPPEVNDAV